MKSEPARADQLESGVRIGDFEIEKRLGAGGMGIVYQARQISLNRRVALKVLGPALDQDLGIARFQREARAVARLKHPGIAALHFIGQDAEVCYHVMELVEGTSLRRVLERLAATDQPDASPDTVASTEGTASPGAPLVRFDQPTTDQASVPTPPNEDLPSSFLHADAAPLSPAAKQLRRNPRYVRRCVEIVLDVARALAYAHGEGVVHRDIKPENLMLDPQGRVHIIDFGLARFFDDVSLTNTGQLVGTPLYMSPEQVTGRIKLDHRTDIYSLGMVLYELLSLRRPIDCTSRENLLRNIVARALPPLCARNRSLSRELEAVVHKATHKDPEDRYQSAAAFAADLERFLAGKPVTAPPFRYRLDLREILGNRPGAVVFSAFVCLLVGGGVSLALLSVALMMAFIVGGGLGELFVPLVQALIAGAVFAVSVLLGTGLLAGRSWARWVAVALAGGCALASLGACLALAFFAISAGKDLGPDTPRNFVLGMVAMYSAPLLVALISAVTSFISLLLPSTGSWFRAAGQMRREHRALLRSLED